MPKGKAYIGNGVTFSRPKLPEGVNEISLRNLQKKNAPQYREDEWITYRERIRDVVGKYVGSKRAQKDPLITKTMTVTEQTQQLRRVRIAAKRVKSVSSGEKYDQALEELIDCFGWTGSGINLLVRNLLNTRVRRIIPSAKDILLYLNQIIDGDKTIEHFQVLQILACDQKQWEDLVRTRYPVKRDFQIIMKDTTTPSASNFVDQFLIMLVKELAPIWVSTTGRTLKKQTKDVGQISFSLFANWIIELITNADEEPPEVGAIMDIVLAQNL